MSNDLRSGGIAILDFGSQYTQLIARRIRDLGVYAELFPHDATPAQLNTHIPRGYIFSGSPDSIYEDGAPSLHPDFAATLHQVANPVLGICYGMHLVAHGLQGRVEPGVTREYGHAHLYRSGNSSLFEALPPELDVWMSHGDHVSAPPLGFEALAHSDDGLLAAIGDEDRRIYGVQFHPEVSHTPQGQDLLRNFVFNICGCEANWTPVTFIEDAVERIRAQVRDGRVLLAMSGGVDSAVAGALLREAVGDQLLAVFVNTGMLRKGEPEQVIRAFRDEQGISLIAVNATETFLDRLQNVTDPEAKRKIIGATFIDVFREQADQLEDVRYLAQGTIYPDVIESATEHKTARTIKSHHNVGGLPLDFKARFELVEPLRDLFKDEVRQVGAALGLPDDIIWRQPFPGPGLGIRCLGDLTFERLETLRAADAVFLDELKKANMLRDDTAQCFAVLLPVKSVGVMGDKRTYEEVIVLRAVTTDDFMTADWARLPYDLLARISRRIVNEVKGINRVTYDITSKPPGTIEWE